MCKAGQNQIPDRFERNRGRQEPFLPVLPIAPDNGSYIVLIDFRIILTDFVDIAAIAGGSNDLAAARKGDLGIGDDGGGKQGMCPAAFGAFYTADFEPERTFMRLYLARVITMEAETAGVAAGTGKLVKLYAVEIRIINILSQGIAFFHKKGYHSIGCHDQRSWLW